MRRTTAAAAVALLLLCMPVSASAVRDSYDDMQSHPLRIAAYVLHPIGYAAEWLLMRPLHFIVSSAGPVFGHSPHGANVVD